MRYVYVVRNLINGKVYVGQTKNFANRKAGHLYAMNRDVDRPLYRSMRKHGVENFSFEVLEECVDELINDREIHWVAHFDSFNPEKGYNLTSGGKQNLEVSKETRQKISRYWRGRKQTQEHVENRAQKLRGQKRTPEQRERFSQSQNGLATGRVLGPMPEERRQKLRHHWEQKRLERKHERSCSQCGLKFEIRRKNRLSKTCSNVCRYALIAHKLVGNQNHRGSE